MHPTIGGLAMMGDIENCSWKFEFQCPRRWASLRLTDDPNVRLCESCLQQVHLCQNDEEVLAHSQRGECVALGFMRDGEESQLLGKVLPET
jgi:hypothetical protein